MRRDNFFEHIGWQELAVSLNFCTSLWTLSNFHRVKALLGGSISGLVLEENDAALGIIPFLSRSASQLTSLEIRYFILKQNLS